MYTPLSYLFIYFHFIHPISIAIIYRGIGRKDKKCSASGSDIHMILHPAFCCSLECFQLLRCFNGEWDGIPDSWRLIKEGWTSQGEGEVHSCFQICSGPCVRIYLSKQPVVVIRGLLWLVNFINLSCWMISSKLMNTKLACLAQECCCGDIIPASSLSSQCRVLKYL